VGSATSILESVVPHLEKDIVAPSVNIALDMVRAEIQRHNPAPTAADVFPVIPPNAAAACSRLPINAETVRETLKLQRLDLARHLWLD
jgi:hypothetical protein